MDAFTNIDAPFVMSRSTFTYLCELSDYDAGLQGRIARKSILPEHLIEDNARFGCFPVYHAPGSYGFYYNDGRTAIIYPGDMCLRNGFYDFRARFRNLVDGVDSSNKWVVIDATLASRDVDHLILNEEIGPKDLMRKIARAVTQRNIFFVSNSPETLAYTYLTAFHLTNQHETLRRVKIFVSDKSYSLCQVLVGPMLKDAVNEKDPVMESLFGRGRSNFAESHRLYPLSAVTDLKNSETAILLTSLEELSSMESLLGRMYQADVYLLGTLALRREVPASLLASQPWQILRIASPDWSFHSSEADLRDMVDHLTRQGVKVILCHDFPNRLKKYSAAVGYDPDYVKIMSKNPIPLS